MLSPTFQPGRLERCQGTGSTATTVGTGIQQRQLHILDRTGPSQQVKTLEDKANLFVAHLGQLIARHLGHVDFPEPDAPMMATNSPDSTRTSIPRKASTRTSPRS